MRGLARAVLVGVCLAGAGCAPLPHSNGAASPAVLLISIDGLRADAVTETLTPTLHRLRAGGRAAAEARTVEPSLTVPSHVSMLTGIPPAEHGVVWNVDRLGAEGYVRETAFEIARRHGCRTAAFMSKRKLRLLFPPEAVDDVYVPRAGYADPAEQVLEEALAHLRFRSYDLVMVHLSEPDIAGHFMGGFGRGPYRWAVRRADRAVARLLAAVGPETTVLITADHGGEGLHHRSGREVDYLIPWIAHGGGVEPGTIPGTVSIMDTAPTVLRLLGIEPPAHWEGRAVELRDGQPANAVVPAPPVVPAKAGTQCRSPALYPNDAGSPRSRG